ncbi:Zinc finger protein PLAGL1 [Halotydeus destructor]|nr:Zinc finger protein PLAGL1 [Halotydeus destructor]
MKMQRPEHHSHVSGLTDKPDGGHQLGQAVKNDHQLPLDIGSSRMRQPTMGQGNGNGRQARGKSTSQPGQKIRVQRSTKRPPSERRFKCDQCDRMFFTRKDVKRHMVVHTGIRNFACPFCQQRFGRKDHLVRHAKKSHNRDTRCAPATPGGPPVSRKGSTTSSASHQASGPHHGYHGPPSGPPGHHALPQALPLPNSSLIDTESSLPHHTYGNSHHHVTGDQHPSLLLLTSNSHMTQHANYGAGLVHHQATSHYAPSGLHHQEDLMASQRHLVKTEPSPHYFPFSVASSSTFGSQLMTSCFVTNAAGRGFCAPSGPHGPLAGHGQHHHHAHQLQIPVCANDHGQPNSLSAFSLEVNPALPHFNQAFQ